MHASFHFINQILQLAYTTQACILNLTLMQMQASTRICIEQMQTTKFMSLLPLLVCFSCLRNYDPSLFSNVAPSLSIFMSNLLSFHILSLPLHNLSLPPIEAFISLYNLSPFVINFHKRLLLIDAKVYIWGRWLMLESCIFYGHLHDSMGHPFYTFELL